MLTMFGIRRRDAD